MIRQYEENLKMQGLTLQQFYQFTNSDEAALKDQMREEAEKRVASRLLLEAIKVEEKIEIADDEAKKEAERIEVQKAQEEEKRAIEQQKRIEDELQKNEGNILLDKTIDNEEKYLEDIIQMEYLKNYSLKHCKK